MKLRLARAIGRRYGRPRGLLSGAVGLLGAAIVVWSLTASPLSLINASSQPVTTRVCINRFYSFTAGCQRATHTVTQAQAGQTYIVTQVPPGASKVDEYQILGNDPGGGTTQVADRAINSALPRYVLALSDLWSSQGAKVTPGSYQLITVSGNHNSSYSIRVESSPKPAHPTTTTTSSTTTSTGSAP